MKRTTAISQGRRWSVMVCLWSMLALPGCGPHLQTAKPVDVDEARQTLTTVLDDWAGGGKPEDWLQQSPRVVVQDFDWSSGARLKSYEILGSGQSRDANLFCQVKLVLENQAQKQVEQTVTYCVGTDPVLTVFRALDP